MYLAVAMVLQLRELKERYHGDAVAVMARVLELCSTQQLHAKLGVLLEVAEQLGAQSEEQLLQVGKQGFPYKPISLPYNLRTRLL